MLISSSPGSLLWPAAMIVWGPGYTSSGHAHHCVQLVMALEHTLRIRGNPSHGWIQCGAALVRPDAQHEVEALNRTVLIAFVEPESELGTALAERIDQSITAIDPREVNRWRASLGAAEYLEAAPVERWVRQELLAGRKSPKLHPGVRRVLRFVREALADTNAFTSADLAKIAGLSASRFGHVFSECTGVPLRRYLLWLRLQRASGELMKGASTTQAAHRAGFSDAAHMARTFRRMLGTTPQELAGRRTRSQGVFVNIQPASGKSL